MNNNVTSIQTDMEAAKAAKADMEAAKAAKADISIGIIDVEKAKGFEAAKTTEAAKAAFDSCRYNDAEQTFVKMKGSEAAAWRILCHIITGDIGKRGGKISTLLQESIQNQDATIGDTITLLKTLIGEYEHSIDRRTKNKAMALLHDIFDNIMKEKMAMTISDINKRALQIVKEKGYTPSTYDDKTIPLKVLNSKLKKYRYRIRHYKPEEISSALNILNNDSFLQDVVDEYMSMAHSHIARIEKDCLDSRDQDVLRYIRSLYISNIAYEKQLKFTRSINKLQFIGNLNNLNERGWVRIVISCTQRTKHFNMANDEEKAICEIEIERASAASAVVSLIYDDIIEKRGYLIYDGIVNQISKEDIAIGDVTNKYTHEYVGPVPGTIYYD